MLLVEKVYLHCYFEQSLIYRNLNKLVPVIKKNADLEVTTKQLNAHKNTKDVFLMEIC